LKGAAMLACFFWLLKTNQNLDFLIKYPPD
jgi:hypothetical protein